MVIEAEKIISLPEIYYILIPIYYHEHIRQNLWYIIHRIQNLRDDARLLYQHYRTVEMLSWNEPNNVMMAIIKIEIDVVMCVTGKFLTVHCKQLQIHEIYHLRQILSSPTWIPHGSDLNGWISIIE